MPAFVTAVYLFLYVPIGIVVLFSFTASRFPNEFTGPSLEWYGKALSNPFVLEALTNSLIVAGTTGVLSTVIGCTTALGLARLRGPLRAVFDGLIYVAIMVPAIVIGSRLRCVGRTSSKMGRMRVAIPAVPAPYTAIANTAPTSRPR